MKKLLYNVEEIRAELREVRRNLIAMKAHHINAWAEKHVEPCKCCKELEDNIHGVNRTIRHFGGKPRYR